MERTMAETSAVAAEEVEEQNAAAAEERGMKKVLVPVDESDGSFYALRWAVEHLFDNYAAAPEQEQAAVTLVNVQPVFHPFIYPAGPGRPKIFILISYFI